jgi:propionyl-CoA carboxylase alpha chain
MLGLVVSIAVKEGRVEEGGEAVAVVEAMKMENVLRAEIDGTVKKINAEAGRKPGGDP